MILNPIDPTSSNGIRRSWACACSSGPTWPPMRRALPWEFTSLEFGGSSTSFACPAVPLLLLSFSLDLRTPLCGPELWKRGPGEISRRLPCGLVVPRGLHGRLLHAARLDAKCSFAVHARTHGSRGCIAAHVRLVPLSSACHVQDNPTGPSWVILSITIAPFSARRQAAVDGIGNRKRNGL